MLLMKSKSSILLFQKKQAHHSVLHCTLTQNNTITQLEDKIIFGNNRNDNNNNYTNKNNTNEI